MILYLTVKIKPFSYNHKPKTWFPSADIFTILTLSGRKGVAKELDWWVVRLGRFSYLFISKPYCRKDFPFELSSRNYNLYKHKNPAYYLFLRQERPPSIHAMKRKPKIIIKALFLLSHQLLKPTWFFIFTKAGLLLRQEWSNAYMEIHLFEWRDAVPI